MRDSIYTIPVSEVFEPKCGCPICTMRDIVENRAVEYIMGAAMMEPDIREVTNKLGFCTDHFKMMTMQKNRLSIGLILQSHLEYIKKQGLEKQGQSKFKKAEKSDGEVITESCYVCEKISQSMDRMIDNMILMWVKEESFRELFSQQEYLCFTHYNEIMKFASKNLNKKQFPEFYAVAKGLTLKKLDSLKLDIDGFCDLFDYRRAGNSNPDENVKTAIERTLEYLTSREFLQDSQS